MKGYFPVFTSLQPPLPEGSMLEHGLAKLSHGFFYFALLFLPMSGIAVSVTVAGVDALRC